jgi:acyl-CoA synthetase (AMP-forming)/AMP-acid ligase II
MIFTSPYPDIEIPEISVTAYALRNAGRLAERPALIDGPTGRTILFGQLTEQARRAAIGLAARGYRKGDVIGIFAFNALEYVIAFHAIASIGGIVTTVNPTFTVDELARQLQDTGACCLMTSVALIDRAAEAAGRAGIREVIVFEGKAPGTDAIPFSTLLVNDGPWPDVSINPKDDVVAILSSSGTTGLPKGVQLTHVALVAAARLFSVCAPIGEEDTIPGQLSMFHIFGLVVTIIYVPADGARSIVMPRFEIGLFAQLAEAYGFTQAFAAPPMVLALARDPLVDQYDFSTLRTMTSGGAPLGAEVALACGERLGCVVRQGYGMTEIVPTHASPMDAHPSKAGTVGPCLACTECKIVDVVTGADLNANHPGEIWLRSPAAMKGYLNQPEATAATIDADGWVHSGDIGFVDDDGYLTVVDRLKELIKFKGHQVAPAELEALLLSHPMVADAAVIPAADEAAGEIPKAFVVLKGEATAEELMAYVAERVAPFKKVRRVEFTDQIPRSLSGKILRRVLVERERAASMLLA